jgi:hypothetical protein
MLISAASLFAGITVTATPVSGSLAPTIAKPGLWASTIALELGCNVLSRRGKLACGVEASDLGEFAARSPRVQFLMAAVRLSMPRCQL